VETNLFGSTGIPPSKVLTSAGDGASELFLKNGGDVERIFWEAGVQLSDFDTPISEINLFQYCKMFELAAKHTQNPNIGLHFGQNFQPKQLGMLGYAAISSPTLAAGLKNMELYFPAHQGRTSFSLIQDDGIIWLNYHILDERIKNKRQDAELSLGMFCNVFKAAHGKNWSPLEVRFEHAEPEGFKEHEKVFNSKVLFGRRTNAIAFRRRDLDVRMPDHDPYLFSVVKAFLENRCTEVGNLIDFATIVRNEVTMQLGSRIPSLPEIASILGMTNTNFQKKLRQHGVTFPDVLKAARHELALHYMDDPDMQLTDIAYNLGYSELSAFSRAFRSWTGMSPQRFRRT
jgi:AraC-like DNA-binding protein